MITPELVNKALLIVRSSPANYEYFFSRLTSPAWITPLRNAGRFTKPAQAIKEKGSITFVTWPESRYLVRMAPKDAELVRDVILEAERTDNERVHQDYVEAALEMPADVAAPIAKAELDWIRKQPQLYTLYPDKVAELAVHLAKGENSDLAIRLARALLRITAEPDSASTEDQEDAFRWPKEPHGLFRDWEYNQILLKYVPALVLTTPRRALLMLMDLLEAAVRTYIGTSEHEVESIEEEQSEQEDYSFIWQPNIGDREGEDVRQSLVTAVTQSALNYGDSAKDAEELLLGRRWRVFRRIAAYLFLIKETVPSDASIALLTSAYEYRDFPGSSLEFERLLSKHFKLLPKEAKSKIFEIMSNGPNLEPMKKRRREEGNPVTEEELADTADQWRLAWLRKIEHELSPEWKIIYEDLVNKFGEPPLEEQRFKTGSWVGPTSPVAVSEIAAMSTGELLEFLSSWKGTGEASGASPEGLGRSLAAALASEPEKLASNAILLRRLNKTYVRAALEGFAGAIKAGKELDLEEILKLCEWVIQQNAVEMQARRVMDEDPDWTWARKAVARLLLQGLQQHVIPVKYRDRVWTILVELVKDIPPESGTSYRGFSVGSVSLNVTRGVAFEAIIDYSLWIRKHMTPVPPEGKSVWFTLPEAQEAIEQYINFDNSQAVSEVLGRRFPWLQVLDRDWASSKVPDIFERNERNLGEIAWANYISFCDPYDNVLPLLTQMYSRAIKTIGKGFRSEAKDVDRHLVQHLMVYYWRGRIAIDSEDGLVRQLFASAPVEFRSFAIEFVGRNLRADVPLDKDVKDRLRSLWEWRLREVQNGSNPEELPPFGLWFASDEFDFDWSMENLLKVLRISHKAELDFKVVEHLEVTASRNPVASIQALGLMLEGDKEGWAVLGWGDHPRNILQTVLASADQKGKDESRRVINLLGARGHYGFRDLLKM